MKITEIFATFHKINSHCYFELYKGTEHRDLYEILSDYHFRQNHFAGTLPRQSLRDRSNADLKVDAPRRTLSSILGGCYAQASHFA